MLRQVVIGRYGFKQRNVEGQTVVDFAKKELAVVNTYFKKEHRVTYKSDGRVPRWIMSCAGGGT